MKGVRTDMENNHDTSEFVHSIISKLSKLNYIKPAEIPNIDLYMDQVTTFMDSHLSDGKRHSEDKILTKTMINNYAKNDLLPPPVKKKYSKDHMIMLIFIYYFKNILSISDIQSLLTPLSNGFFDGQGSVSLEKIYKEIYNYERSQMVEIAKLISRTQRDSQELFSDVSDEDERRYLQLFSLVCMLSFDVFARKHVIESVIDQLNEFEEAKNPKNSKDKKDKNKN